MHTSSSVDNVDEFSEQVRRGKQMAYRYGSAWRPLLSRPISLRYRAANGKMASRSFTTWRTHRGPIVRSENGRWIAFAMMDRPVAALQQSFLRTKATNLASFLDAARLQANSSNNTIFADGEGAIAYLHPQFVPRRSDRLIYQAGRRRSRADWNSLNAQRNSQCDQAPKGGYRTPKRPWRRRGLQAVASRFRSTGTCRENARGVHASSC